MNGIFEILKVQVNGPLHKRGESTPEYPEKPPDNQPENRYHTLEVKIHRRDRGIEPQPSNIGDKFDWSELAGSIY